MFFVFKWVLESKLPSQRSTDVTDFACHWRSSKENTLALLERSNLSLQSRSLPQARQRFQHSLSRLFI